MYQKFYTCNNYLQSYDIDIKEDIFELSMAIGNLNEGKRFKPITKTLKELNKGVEVKEIWQLPSNSHVELSYNIKNNTVQEISSPSKKRVTILPDLTQIMDKKLSIMINSPKLSCGLVQSYHLQFNLRLLFCPNLAS